MRASLVVPGPSIGPTGRRCPQRSQTLDQAGVDVAHGAAIWAGLVRAPVSSLLWYGIGGEEQCGHQADEPVLSDRRVTIHGASFLENLPDRLSRRGGGRQVLGEVLQCRL